MRQILELSDTKLKTTLINMFKPVIGKNMDNLQEQMSTVGREMKTARIKRKGYKLRMP